MTASYLYTGTIRHRRTEPRREFRHRLALAYVDLAELPALLGGRLVRRGPGTLRFRRRDYLGDPSTPLDTAVRDRVAAVTGQRPGGPVRMLTQLRSFGICFNPVSFYYCFGPDGETLHSVLAEVTNTPWGDRHAYVIPGGAPLAAGEFAKALHVSPFQPMDRVYHARETAPDETLSVHIESRRVETVTFDATLAMRRRALTPAHVRRMIARHPAAGARVPALIYGHAAGLALAGARRHPHPATPTAR